MSTHPTGVGWACPSLLRASFFLRATAQQALGESSLELGEEDDLPAPAPEAMAAALALNLPEPRPYTSLLILAGAALQALLEQQPLPACAPEAIFGTAYSPALAALPGPAKVALLCASDMAVLPTPTTTVIVACLAQHYASLPRAAFETEVAAASPRAAGMALQWWSAMFGTGSYAGGAGGATHKSLPPVALGLDPWSPAEEHWARGLDLHTGSSQPPPPSRAHPGAGLWQDGLAAAPLSRAAGVHLQDTWRTSWRLQPAAVGCCLWPPLWACLLLLRHWQGAAAAPAHGQAGSPQERAPRGAALPG